MRERSGPSAECAGSGNLQAQKLRSNGRKDANNAPSQQLLATGGDFSGTSSRRTGGTARPRRRLESRARERAPKSYTLERLRRCSECGELRNLESRRQFRGNCVGRHVGATAVGGEGPSQGELCLIGIRGREIPARDRKVIRGERSGHKV